MRITAVVFAIMLAAGAAEAQSGGRLAIYSDNPGFTDCNLTETLLASNEMFVVHTGMTEAITVQFKVIHNWYNATVAQVTYPGNLALGDIFTGVAVTYVGCKPLPHLVAVMTFVPSTPTPECTMLIVAPDPSLESGEIEVVDCSANVLYATWGWACVNTPGCCIYGVHPWWCEPIATEATTWGAIKALYR